MGEKGEEDEFIESGNEKADEVAKEGTDEDGEQMTEASALKQFRQDIVASIFMLRNFICILWGGKDWDEVVMEVFAKEGKSAGRSSAKELVMLHKRSKHEQIPGTCRV